MSTTLVGNDEDLTRQDALEWIGITDGNFTITGGQRLGQAWYNQLTPEDQYKLNGTFFDPFYRDSWRDIILALRFLLEN